MRCVAPLIKDRASFIGFCSDLLFFMLLTIPVRGYDFIAGSVSAYFVRSYRHNSCHFGTYIIDKCQEKNANMPILKNCSTRKLARHVAVRPTGRPSCDLTRLAA
jgi:hypothetical protein